VFFGLLNHLPVVRLQESHKVTFDCDEGARTVNPDGKQTWKPGNDGGNIIEATSCW